MKVRGQCLAGRGEVQRPRDRSVLGVFEKQDSDQGDRSMVSGGERGWKRWGGLQKPGRAGPVGLVRTLVSIVQ